MQLLAYIIALCFFLFFFSSKITSRDWIYVYVQMYGVTHALFTFQSSPIVVYKTRMKEVDLNLASYQNVNKREHLSSEARRPVQMDEDYPIVEGW